MTTRRLARCLLVCAALAGLVVVPALRASELSVEEVVAKHLAARGGVERWLAVETLHLTGTYAAFSQRSEFALVRRSDDSYRLDFELLEAPAIRAHDGENAWGLHKLLFPEPTTIADGPYRKQFAREAMFGPLLLRFGQEGFDVSLVGEQEHEGRRAIALRVVFGDGQEETWLLDAETYLETAVDSEVFDYTQAGEPIRQRAFFDDFREVDGLVIPHQVDLEFGHRLESMTVDQVEVDTPAASGLFAAPPARAESPPD